MTHMIGKPTDGIKTLKYRNGFDIDDHLTKMFTIRRQLKEY